MGLRFRVLREGLQAFLGQGLGISAWALGPQGFGVLGCFGFRTFFRVALRSQSLHGSSVPGAGHPAHAQSRGVLDLSEHVLAWGLDRFLWLD